MDRRHRVLAIVGDTQVGLWVIRSLARNGLEVHAITNTIQGQSAHSRYSASSWLLDNRPSDPVFNDEIMQLAGQLDIGQTMKIESSVPEFSKTAVVRWVENITISFCRAGLEFCDTHKKKDE